MSLFFSSSTSAATHYVSVSNSYPVSPYLSWTSAATSIQEAISVASTGDTVIVDDGQYSGDYNAGYGARIAITNAIAVQSARGSQYTVIDGGSTVRCCYVSSGASLSGFRLTGGNTPSNGGGAYCDVGAIISNCVIAANTAGLSGGGVYQGSAFNCLIEGNSAQSGGGAAGCTLENCTVVNNSASLAGGIAGGTNWNSIVVRNWPSNYVANPPIQWIYSCTFPDPGVSNTISAEPDFVDETNGDFGLLSYSPCVNAGVNRSWMTNATDLDGHSRISYGNVDMGCYESGWSNTTGSGWAIQIASYRTYVTALSYSDGLGLFRYEFYGGLPNPDFAFCLTPGNGSIPLQICGATNVICPSGWAASIAPRNVTLYSTNPAGCWLADPHVVFDVQTTARGWAYLQTTMNSPFCQKYNVGNCGSGSEYFDYVAPTSPPASYWTWATNITNGLTNYDDSATGDGYPNLLKYATGSSATNTDNLAQLTGEESNGLMSVSFSRNTNAADLTLVIEQRNSLSTGGEWNAIATYTNGSWGGATNVVEIGATSPFTVNVRSTYLAGAATNGYIRLRVGMP